mmetsp:Transcript_8613/g.26179  ORF Transcript_8613/g.26179 Transcript_8613/m.26179 type:complete len:320 (-) Transcript_8613:783-1742(-)
MRAACEADHRHSHQQRLARRRRVRIREGVQGNVDLVVDLQVVERRGRERHQLEPILSDAVALEVLDEGGLHVRRVEALVLHQQAAARHLAQHAGPEGDARRADLGQAAEAAEGDVACAERRQWLDIWNARRRRVTEETTWQPDELLAERLLAVWGVNHRVCHAIVDGSEPGRVVVPYVGKLDRRRLQGHDVQSVVGGVARELNEDVDAVFPDKVCNLLRRPPEDLLPAVWRDHILEELGLLILASCVGIQVNVEELAVPVLKQAVAEEGHGVGEKVGGYVPHSQRPLHLPGTEPICKRMAQLAAKPLAPGTVRCEDPLA